jgi:hypothetical protein
MIELHKTGGRTIHLFIPFEFNGKKIEAITLAPMRLGHTLRWATGDWKSSIEFLVELAGVDEAVIRELRYPDADRVMSAFMDLITPEIRTDIINGSVPQKYGFAREPDEEEKPRATNGSGEEMEGPGAPLPPAEEAGFDLGEEP